MEWLLVLNLVLAAYMLGVIGLIQFIHYPMFDRVAADRFEDFEEHHTAALGWLVGPVMIAELGVAIALLAWSPAGIAAGWIWANAGVVAALWLLTFLVSVPCHRRLTHGFDAEAHRRLVATNWPRTVLWLGRTMVAVVMVLG